MGRRSPAPSQDQTHSTAGVWLAWQEALGFDVHLPLSAPHHPVTILDTRVSGIGRLSWVILHLRRRLHPPALRYSCSWDAPASLLP